MGREMCFVHSALIDEMREDVSKAISINHAQQVLGDAGLSETVIIMRKSEYDSLQEDSLNYRKLEAYGVDNWSGYDTAMSDDEGIFGEEDE